LLDRGEKESALAGGNIREKRMFEASA